MGGLEVCWYNDSANARTHMRHIVMDYEKLYTDGMSE